MWYSLQETVPVLKSAIWVGMGHWVTHSSGFPVRRQIDRKWKYPTWNAGPEVLLSFCMVLTLLLTLFQSRYTDLPHWPHKQVIFVLGRCSQCSFPNYAETLLGPCPVFNFYQHLTLWLMIQPWTCSSVGCPRISMHAYWAHDCNRYLPAEGSSCGSRYATRWVPPKSSLESSGKMHNWRLAAS